MCTGLVLAGTAAQLGGQYAADRANRSASRFNRNVMGLQAKQEEYRGASEATRIREQGAVIAGQQRVGAAAGNVVVNQGTAMKLQEDTAALASEDADEVRRNALLRAWGYRTEAMAERYAQRVQSMGTRFGYAETLLGNVYDAKKAGLWG